MRKQDMLNATRSQIFGMLGCGEAGLSSADAAIRLGKSGLNRLKEKKVFPLSILLAQFRSSLIYILVTASLISYCIKDYSDGSVILIILLINAIIGFMQQYRSEKIIEKLSKLISTQVRVKRSGEMLLVDEAEIVPGDCVTVMEGDIVPADIYVLQATGLEINESELTGESAPASKQSGNDKTVDSTCLVFAGSVVEKGSGTGIVYATGNDTELGQIAKLSTETKRETQYQKSINAFSTMLVKIVAIGLVVIFIFKLLLPGGLSHFSELLVFILAMAVAVVPELLPAITTISLSSGALKLAKKHVVVKRLSSIEDLGNINLLCTDKTGTITENKMAIESVITADPDLFMQLAYASITVLKGRKRRTQSSYDDAFIKYASPEIKESAKSLVIVKELPFDPGARRRRIVLQDNSSGKAYLVVIGAPETLLKLTNDANADTYLAAIRKAGSNGVHHLAIAYKTVDFSFDLDILKNENELAFLGYVGMLDPLRPGSKQTILHARKMGIQVKILTGDSPEVAGYIGRQAGLLNAEDRVYTGDELELLSATDFMAAVNSCNVFARVSPVQKFNIIKALKETYVVGYQGDGINDAPALKLADVAIAVNTATDIAKENADIVLLNRSLEVIINGIKYGRAIFININKYIKHTMISNFGNFIALAVLYLVSTDLPLLPVQILLTTVITDVPLLTIFSDNVEDEDVVAPEKHNVKQLFTLTLILGIPAAIFELVYFVLTRSGPRGSAPTALYVFITFIGLIVFYSIRVKRFFWQAKPSTMLINVSFILALFLSAIIIYIPCFRRWFSFSPLPGRSLLVISGLSIVYFLVNDIIKVGYYRFVSKGKPITEQ